MQFQVRRSSTNGFESLTSPKTFKGDRGGLAIDGDLLAELRAISAKSSSADRFEEDKSCTDVADMSYHESDSHVKPEKQQKKRPKKKKVSGKTVVPLGNIRKVNPTEAKKSEGNKAVEFSSPLERDREKTEAPLPKQTIDRSKVANAGSMPIRKKESSHNKRDAAADGDFSRKEVELDSNSGEILNKGRTKAEELKSALSQSSPSSKDSIESGDEEDYKILAELQAIDASNPEQVGNGDLPNIDNSRKTTAELVVSEDEDILTQKDLGQPDDSDPPSEEDDELLAELEVIDADAARDAEYNFALASKRLSVIREVESNRSIEVDDDEDSKEIKDEGKAHAEIPNAAEGKQKESKEEGTQKVFQIPPLQTKAISDRSGPATDVGLLAELRAISFKSSSVRRFDDQNDMPVSVLSQDEILNASSSPVQKSDSVEISIRTKKQNAEKVDSMKIKSTDNKVDKAPSADAAIVQGSETNNLNTYNDKTKNSQNLSDIKYSSSSFSNNSDGTTESDIIITVENLEDALNSTKWKLRKAAYGMLKSWLSEKVNGKQSTNDLDGNEIVPSMDLIVVKIVKETNISALDEALSFAILYADHCEGASEAQHAANICASLLKGPALSSRPTSVKLAKGLVLKLMEVGRDGYGSIHSVIDVLFSDGLTSKKPKNVLNSISLVVEAALGFGVHTLPLQSVSSNASVMLSHANNTVRENGVKLIAELCRSIGSKDALENVISLMKPAQLSHLDSLLKEQEQPSLPSIGLRLQKNSEIESSGPSGEMIVTLKSLSLEEKAKKFESQIAVNIVKEIIKTDFAFKINEAKWSEKVAAIDILLDCGGKKPYKFCQPNALVDYHPLIKDLKQLLGHTHFLVKSKALIGLGMLAEGVGEKLFSHIRPLVRNVIELLKDKKVIQACCSCLDSFFGNVIAFDHLLEKEDAIMSAVNVKAHPLVRKGALEFMRRCIERADSAGTRGSISIGNAESIIKLCFAKLSDQDAGVRRESCNILNVLLKNDDSGIKALTDTSITLLEKKDPGAYKTLMRAISDKSIDAMHHSKRSISSKATKITPAERKVTAKIPQKMYSPTSKPGTQKKNPQTVEGITNFVVDVDERNIPNVEDSYVFLSQLGIQNWDDPEDTGGISSGLKSTTWMYRKKAIEGLASFLRSNEAKEADPSCAIHVLLFIKSYTKNFKESNLNLVKALIDVFIAVSGFYISAKLKLEVWICDAAITLALGKISDKKLTKSTSDLLSLLCEVQKPEVIVSLCIEIVKPMKSPLIHEGLLTWFQSYCDDFGVSTLQKSLNICVNWVVEEYTSSNVKIRAAASILLGEMHTQLGPVLETLIMSSSGLESSIRLPIENLFSASPFDPSSAKINRQRMAFVEQDSNDDAYLPSVAASIPKTDLVAALPANCLTRMAAKEGKIAWKIRKEALDEVENVFLQNKCILSTTSNCMKSLIELCRMLKERLNDLQSNLKPLAARNIAHVLGSVDSVSQAKLARIVCGPLISAVMYDNKKLMRDASLAALEKCTAKMDIEGGGVNTLSIKSFMTALLAETGDSDFKAIGLPSILEFATKKSEYFPHVDSSSSPKSKALEIQFSAMIVACLTSSKTETRSRAELLLDKCIKCGTVNPQSIEKCVGKLTQTEQKNVRIVINSLGIDMTKKVPHLHSPTIPRRTNTAKNPASLQNKSDGKKSNRVVAKFDPSTSSSKHPESLRKEKKSMRGDHGAEDTPRRFIRDSYASSKRDTNSFNVSLNDLLDDPHFTALISNNGATSTKAHRALIATRNRDPWPEYPDEPSSKELLKTLKQIWSPLLPTQSISIIFPSNDICRQDDVCDGCALMTDAFTMLEAKGQEYIVVDQLDLIHKWLAFAICCRESTAGMQAIIPFISKLFSLLRRCKYQMTDTEGGILLPYLLEKAGIAKERFRDMLFDLLESLACGDIFPLVKYGSITCVSVIEMSSFPKARVLATHQCYRCVENCGPKAIGKKGIQLLAKLITNEKNSENRTAYLDLIELIIQKMNGNMHKFLKVCGRSNLSGKARELIEEQWLHHENLADTSATKTQPSMVQISATIKRSSTTQFGSTKPLIEVHQDRLDPHPSNEISSGTSSKKTRLSTVQSLVEESRPSTTGCTPTKPLNSFRQGILDSHKSNSTSNLLHASNTNKLSHKLPSLNLNENKKERRRDLLTSSLNDKKGGSNKFMYKKIEGPSLTDSKSATGSVVPLRERMRIISEQRRSEKVFNKIMCDVDDLLSQQTPLGDNESISNLAVTGLRRVHASLTRRGKLQTDAGEISLEDLRENVKNNLPYCVARLTSVLGFGFRCGSASKPDALHTPLFSVSIAGLMAILSDSTLSVLIPEEVLILVIRRAASGLLDRRLVGNLKESNHGVDSSTLAKIAKAINKLAVQATLGVNRHVSLQSLLSLQLQICSASVQEAVAITDVGNIHNRMSRIITRLFLRVIQVAENESPPFSGKNMDLFSLLGSLEGYFQKARSVKGLSLSAPKCISRGIIDDSFVCDDRMVPLLTMGRNVMLHILKPSQEIVEETKDIIDRLRMSEVSLTRRLFNNCCNELGFGDICGNSDKEDYDTDQVSELIFAIGKAEEEEDKMYAFDDLRDFLRKHREVDIEHHLSNLSSPFRKYVLDELKNPNPFRPPLSTDSLSILSGFSGESSHTMTSRFSRSDAQVIKSTRSLLSIYSDDSSRSLFSGCTSDTESLMSTTESVRDRVRKLKEKIYKAKETAQSMLD